MPYLIPAITDHRCSPLERDVLALPVRLGGLGITNPCREADIELSSSVKATAPLVQQMVAQSQQLPENSLVKPTQQAVKSERGQKIKGRADLLGTELRSFHTHSWSGEKGSSVWLTILPLREMGYNLYKREFRDAIKLRYD